MMMPFITGEILLLISLLHVYWLFGGRWGLEASLPPSRSGDPVRPPRVMVVVVILGLLFASAMAFSLAGWITIPLSERWMIFCYKALGYLFLARGILGFAASFFFRPLKGTLFNRWNLILYSPLCTWIGAVFLGFI